MGKDGAIMNRIKLCHQAARLRHARKLLVASPGVNCCRRFWGLGAKEQITLNYAAEKGRK